MIPTVGFEGRTHEESLQVDVCRLVIAVGWLLLCVDDGLH